MQTQSPLYAEIAKADCDILKNLEQGLSTSWALEIPLRPTAAMRAAIATSDPQTCQRQDTQGILPFSSWTSSCPQPTAALASRQLLSAVVYSASAGQLACMCGTLLRQGFHAEDAGTQHA